MASKRKADDPLTYRSEVLLKPRPVPRVTKPRGVNSSSIASGDLLTLESILNDGDPSDGVSTYFRELYSELRRHYGIGPEVNDPRFFLHLAYALMLHHVPALKAHRNKRAGVSPKSAKEHIKWLTLEEVAKERLTPGATDQDLYRLVGDLASKLAASKGRKVKYSPSQVYGYLRRARENIMT